jgi:2-dehydropantoate 2-reductase
MGAAIEMNPIGKVAIVGAGAMGSLFAARIAETGAEVVVIDVDAERLATIDSEGIELTDDTGTRTVPVRAALAAQVDESVDLVILFTKGMHSAAALASIDHLRAARPIALTLQNGIGNAELLAQAFGADRVVIGTALIPADLTGPRSVRTQGFASISVGPMAPGAGLAAGEVAALLSAAGFSVEQRDDIVAAVWEKVAFNAALNAIAMICEVPNSGIDNVSGRRIADAVADETVAVAAARGVMLDRAGIGASIDAALREHRDHKASMLHDREMGRPTEIEMINGAIAREGRRLGVPTPVCDTLSDLVRLIEAATGAR